MEKGRDRSGFRLVELVKIIPLCLDRIERTPEKIKWGPGDVCGSVECSHRKQETEQLLIQAWWCNSSRGEVGA